jgi:hypothetical protein
MIEAKMTALLNLAKYTFKFNVDFVFPKKITSAENQ